MMPFSLRTSWLLATARLAVATVIQDQEQGLEDGSMVRLVYEPEKPPLERLHAIRALRETAEAGCMEEGAAWRPLDMEGSKPTIEVDAEACQRRCLRTKECYHFTFQTIHGHCHLQDAAAKRQSIGHNHSVAGPFQCWDEIVETGEIQQGKRRHYADKEREGLPGYLPEQFTCLEMGLVWEPAVKIPMKFEGTKVDLVTQCQSFCAMAKGCWRFTLEPETGNCWVVEHKARPVPGDAHTVSGLAICGKQAPDVFMQKKYGTSMQGDQETEADWVKWTNEDKSSDVGSSSFKPVHALFVALALLGVAAVWGLRLWKRSVYNKESLEMGEEPLASGKMYEEDIPPECDESSSTA